jgi:hypothetical protein
MDQPSNGLFPATPAFISIHRHSEGFGRNPAPFVLDELVHVEDGLQVRVLTVVEG